ncbi:low affinity iron permease family protein [Candidatus Saccharibacteria bacterium]|nr:low affinity iron permease family protein [Candidatus Saccharibacteria bacterium]
MNDFFRKIATKVSQATGSAGAFLVAFTAVVAWAVTGPLFNFSNTWQLLINTATTIGTFLMVFLIQNTQNRDGRAMQLKLDELIRATRARDEFIDIEDLDDEELGRITEEFSRIHESSNDPILKKFHAKLQAVHHDRKHPRAFRK